MKKIIALILTFITTTVFAWPTQDITLIVPYPPGGVNDQLARLMQPDLESILRVRVQVLNFPGAANSVAINHVMGKPNDDHTFIVSMNDFIVGPLYQNNTAYTNFKAVNIIGSVPYVMFGNSKASTEKLQRQIQQKATVNVGNNGINGGAHLWITNLKSPLTINSIFYKGSTPVLTDTMAGHIEYGVSSIAASYNFIQAGNLIPVMQSGQRRSTTLPKVPTQHELGFRGPDASTWFAIYSRKDTSDVAVNKFSASARLIISNNPYLQEFKTTGMNITNLGLAESDVFFKQQIQLFEASKNK